jgi:hypothetical protein
MKYKRTKYGGKIRVEGVDSNDCAANRVIRANAVCKMLLLTNCGEYD